MKRITFLAVITGIVVLTMTACGKTGNEISSITTDTLQTAVEASESPQTVIEQIGSQAEREASVSIPSTGGKTGKNDDAVEKSSSNQTATPAATSATAATQAAISSKAGPMTKVEKPDAGKSTGVVAESGNIVSGQDNGKVMSELDKELDALFSSINRLDDVDRAELTGEENVK